MKISSRLTFISIAAALTLAVTSGVLTAARSQKWWWDHGGGPSGSHFVDLDQVNKSNVKQLEVAWFYPHGNIGFNPIVVDDMMFVSGRSNSLDRARPDHGQGNLDSREPAVVGAGHQLLAERRRQGEAPAADDRTVPPGDRREDRQVDHDLRIEWLRRPARWDAAGRERHSRAESRQGLEEPPHSRQCAWRRVDVAAGRHSRVRRDHRQAGLAVPHDSAAW